MVVFEKKIYLFNIIVNVNIRILVNKKIFKIYILIIFFILWLLFFEKGKIFFFNNLEFFVYKDIFIKFG